MGQKEEDKIFLENISMFFVQTDDGNTLKLSPEKYFEYNKNKDEEQKR